MPITADDIRKLASSYTDAWCSGSGERVAAHFCADAQSIINRGEPTHGRKAIAGAMGVFFEEFPDLVLHMDALRSGGNQAIYLWTLEGTHGETGHFVRIAGWQNWLLSDDGLIALADGGYDAEEYDRQVREGIRPA